MSTKQHTSDVARNIATQVKKPNIAAFCEELNERLEACYVHVALKTNFGQPSYLVFLLEKDGEVVSHITCFEYFREGVYWVGINSFTSEPHRRHHYNLLLRAVAIAVITMLYEGTPMNIYSSISNWMSLQALGKYFKIHTRDLNSEGHVRSVLLDGHANQQQVKSVIDNFVAKCARADPVLKGGFGQPAWALPVGSVKKDRYNRTWVVKKLSPHTPGKTWVLARKSPEL